MRTRLAKIANTIDRLTVVILVGFALFMAAVAYGLYVNIQAGQKSQTALCAFRNDLEVRVEAAQRFLNENPDGTEQFARDSLISSLRNQQQTLKTLDTVLECDTVKD